MESEVRMFFQPLKVSLRNLSSRGPNLEERRRRGRKTQTTDGDGCAFRRHVVLAASARLVRRQAFVLAPGVCRGLVPDAALAASSPLDFSLPFVVWHMLISLVLVCCCTHGGG